MSDRDAYRATLLDNRYGRQQKPETILWNEVIERQMAHKSVRTFLADPLPDGAIETMIAAAQSASTSSALQQWSVVAVTDKALKQQLADTIAQTVPTDRIPWIDEAPTLLLWVADGSRTAELTRDQGLEPVMLDHVDGFLMAATDTALAAQNAALAAESIGLGVVFLGIMRNAAKAVAALIDLPPYSFVTFGMAVGHPDPARVSGVRPRLPLPAVLHRDRYEPDRYRAYLEDYEAAYRAFREARGMKPRTWQGSVIEAATSMAYMSGRVHLREMVTERGFALR